MLLSLVVPCFNERGNVLRFQKELFPELARLGVSYEVVAVDDGSTDRTGAALQDLARGIDVLVVKSHPDNRGLGAALRTGFAAAKGDFIATLDADLTFAPAQLKDLLDAQKKTGADLVGGSPFLPGGRFDGVPLARRVPSALVNAFYRGLFSRSLTAYTPIFRLYRAATLRYFPLTSEGFEINAEIAVRFVKAKRTVAEVPAALSVRREGVSKLQALGELGRHAGLIARALFLW